MIQELTRYGAAFAVALVLMVPAPAGAQDATETVDVADLWRLVRKKPPSDPPPDHPGAMRVVAPVIGAKPSAGVMFGAAGNLAFYNGTPDGTRISSVISSVTFSTKQETSIYSRLSIFTNRDRWRLDGDNRAIWGSQNSYGLGTATQSSEAVRTSFNYFRVHATGYRHLGKDVYAGVGLHYDDHSNFAPDDGTDPGVWEGSAFVDYSQANDLSLDRQISAGVSLNLLADTRDSSIDPRRGWYGAASAPQHFAGFLGGSSAWQLTRVGGRGYVPTSEDGRQRLAIWMFGEIATGGSAPYFDLPATGTDTYGRSGRGYAEGYFRGERLVYGEVEYRATLTRNNLIGVVMFANMTTVSNRQQDEQLFDQLAPGGGAGLRVLLNKRSRTNLCLDFGFGQRGSRGVYLAVQEAF